MKLTIMRTKNPDGLIMYNAGTFTTENKLINNSCPSLSQNQNFDSLFPWLCTGTPSHAKKLISKIETKA